MPIEIIGWASTAILLATICRQVYSQWKSKATAGVSRWLFIGQISASIGFAVSLGSRFFAKFNQVQLPASQLGVSFLERCNDCRGYRRRSDLHLKSQATGACETGLFDRTTRDHPDSRARFGTYQKHGRRLAEPKPA